MYLIEKTYETVAENLAFDEAMLLSADDGNHDYEVLRIWHAKSPFVVVGRSGKVKEEVNVAATQLYNVPILRRVSGGATIVADVGCMFYALLLDLNRRPQLRMLDEAHAMVMQTFVGALSPLEPRVAMDGTCDLVIDNRKFSGNSIRMGRQWMLYHGTILLSMDLSRVSLFTSHPPKEPAYRLSRPHADFLTNLRADPMDVVNAIRSIWRAEPAHELEVNWLRLVPKLVQRRYANDAWNFER